MGYNQKVESYTFVFGRSLQYRILLAFGLGAQLQHVDVQPLHLLHPWLACGELECVGCFLG